MREHWAAEELAASANLRRDGEFAQPAVELASAAVSMVEASLERQRQILGKEDLRRPPNDTH